MNGLPFDGMFDPEGESPPARPGSRLAPLSILQINEQIDATLEETVGPVWVRGEISRFLAHASGHWYFTLKDQEASISCAMWRGKNQRLRFRPEDGLEILALATPRLYAPQGRLQLIVEDMEPSGAGAAALALEQLKQRLAAEGLFDPARKKQLPRMPRTVGIITSLDGAALRDALKVLRRRFAGVEVLISPCPVQGKEAPAEIVRALAAIDQRRLDVLLLIRGGGAREDLAAFDDEGVVRAIAAARTPIVTGIGHEIDTTLADFAADLRAPTPSAAAEAVVRERQELLVRVQALQRSLGQSARSLLDRLRRRLAAAEGSRGFRELPRRVDRARMLHADLGRRMLESIRAAVALQRDTLRELERRISPESRLQQLSLLRRRLSTLAGLLPGTVRGLLARDRQRLARAAAALDALSPLAVLSRGYALVSRETAQGELIRSSAGLTPGDPLFIRLGSGAAHAAVTRVVPPADPPPPRRNTR